MHAKDWDRSKNQHWHETKQSEILNAARSLRAIVEDFGADNVYLVSYAEYPSMMKQIRKWVLDTMELCKVTGLLEDHIVFTERKSGPGGKG